MPPPTPSARFIRGPGRLFLQRGLLRGGLCGQQREVFVLHQSAPHLFHRHHRRLPRGGGQITARPGLQLAGPLGGDDDETVGAGFRIIRNRALRGIANRVLRHFETSPRSGGFQFPSGRAGCEWLSRSTSAFPPTPPPRGSPAHNRTNDNPGSPPRLRASAAGSPARNPASGPAAAAPESAG